MRLGPPVPIAIENDLSKENEAITLECMQLIATSLPALHTSSEHQTATKNVHLNFKESSGCVGADATAVTDTPRDITKAPEPPGGVGAWKLTDLIMNCPALTVVSVHFSNRALHGVIHMKIVVIVFSLNIPTLRPRPKALGQDFSFSLIPRTVCI